MALGFSLVMLTIFVVLFASSPSYGFRLPHRHARMVTYVNDTTKAQTDSWGHLARGLNGKDSTVTVVIEPCLSADDVCDSYCGTMQIYFSDKTQEYYANEDSDFSQSLRYAVNVLGAFNCFKANIETCTTETEYAKTLRGTTENQLDELEEKHAMELYDHRRDQNLSSTIRKWVLVQSLLVEIEHKKHVRPTDAEEDFIKYMHSIGTYMGPTVWPMRLNNGPRTVTVDRNIFAGDVLFIGNLQLNPSLAKEAFRHSKISFMSPLPHDNGGNEWDDMFALVAFLALQADLKHSVIAPYINMLRESVDRGVFMWSGAELEALEDDKFVKGLERVKQLQKSYFEAWGNALNKTGENWKLEVFQWAFHVVTSRSFDFEEKTLIPFVDLYNHDSEHGQKLQFETREEDGIKIIRATKAIRRGQEILISYGDDDFSHLLYSYGFVPKPELCPRNTEEGSRESTIEYYRCARVKYSH